MADIDRLATLEADSVGTVTLAADGVDAVQVWSDGAAEVVYRLGYTDAVPGDPDPDELAVSDVVLPAGVVSAGPVHERSGGSKRTVVKLVSEGTPRICVQPIR